MRGDLGQAPVAARPELGLASSRPGRGSSCSRPRPTCAHRAEAASLSDWVIISRASRDLGRGEVPVLGLGLAQQGAEDVTLTTLAESKCMVVLRKQLRSSLRSSTRSATVDTRPRSAARMSRASRAASFGMRGGDAAHRDRGGRSAPAAAGPPTRALRPGAVTPAAAGVTSAARAGGPGPARSTPRPRRGPAASPGPATVPMAHRPSARFGPVLGRRRARPRWRPG